MERDRYQQDIRFSTLKKQQSKSNYERNQTAKIEAVKKRQRINPANVRKGKREYDKAKYTTDQHHRAKKLSAAKEIYKKDKVFREKKNSTLRERQKQKYQTDRIYRENIKKRNRDRYHTLRTY